jgi:hypothetical protein
MAEPMAPGTMPPAAAPYSPPAASSFSSGIAGGMGWGSDQEGEEE